MSLIRAACFTRHLALQGLNLALPPRCIKCNRIMEATQALCAECWSQIRFLGPPWCDCCGLPFAFDEGPDALCASCIANPPRFDRARAVMAYDDGAKPLILALKHADRQHGVPALGTWMARIGAEMLDQADMLVPVPLHWTRLFVRRYNQSALLAYAVARALRKQGKTSPKVAPDLLRRHRRTPSQGRLSRTARALNIRGAFALAPKPDVTGKHVVLIDDVMTTGATIEECSRVLKRAGAAQISVLIVARALRAD